jgi:hypothetical protein
VLASQIGRCARSARVLRIKALHDGKRERRGGGGRSCEVELAMHSFVCDCQVRLGVDRDAQVGKRDGVAFRVDDVDDEIERTLKVGQAAWRRDEEISGEHRSDSFQVALFIRSAR